MFMDGFHLNQTKSLLIIFQTPRLAGGNHGPDEIRRGLQLQAV